MRKLVTLFAVTLAIPLVFACSGGDDGDGGGDTPDAAVQNNPDADTSGGAGIGASCTPDGQGGPGDCGAGFICLELNGINPYCTQTCQMAGDSCPGYTGPGVATCSIRVTDAMGNDLFNACAVLCGPDTDMMQCDDTVCNGQCPGAQQCGPNMLGDGSTLCL